MNPHLSNCENLHPSYGTWQDYLANHCRAIDGHEKGWLLFNNYSNGYYIVGSDGRVYDGLYGYNAINVWNNEMHKRFGKEPFQLKEQEL